MTKHEQYVEAAKEQARKSPMAQKHGAVIVKNNKIIATGYNRYIEQEKACRRISMHAEKDALTNCNQSDLKGAVLYIVRMNPEGELLMSKPCKSCTNYINRLSPKLAGIYYSCS